MEYEPRLYVNAFRVNDQGNDVIKTFFDDQAAAIPEEYVFWRDWRTEDGELAWPERFPYDASGQHLLYYRETTGQYTPRRRARSGARLRSYLASQSARSGFAALNLSL